MAENIFDLTNRVIIVTGGGHAPCCPSAGGVGEKGRVRVGVPGLGWSRLVDELLHEAQALHLGGIAGPSETQMAPLRRRAPW